MNWITVPSMLLPPAAQTQSQLNETGLLCPSCIAGTCLLPTRGAVNEFHIQDPLQVED